MIKFTVREMTMLCLYYAGTQQETIAELNGAMPYIDEPDVLAVVESTAAKLEKMNDAEFAAIGFDPDPLGNAEPLG